MQILKKLILVYIFYNVIIYQVILAQTEINQPEPEVIDITNLLDLELDEQKQIEVMPLEPIKTDMGTEVKIGLTFNLPIIGDITLYPDKDPKTGKNILKGTLAGKQINLDPLPIKFDNFTMTLQDGKIPVVSGDVTVFDKKAKIELVDIKKASKIQTQEVKGTTSKNLRLDLAKIDFRLTFLDKLTLELIPNRPVSLNHVDLILEKGKQATLQAKINIFNNLTDILFSFDKQTKNLTLAFNMENALIGNLVPELKTTPFKDILLKKLSIKTTFRTSKPTIDQDFVSYIDAQTDFSSLNLQDIPISLKDVAAKATISKLKGLNLEGSLTAFSLPILGKIDQAKLVLNYIKAGAALANAAQPDQKSKAELILTGIGTINAPGLTPFNFILNAAYRDKKFDFAGEIKQSVDYKGIKIESAKLVFEPKDQSLTIKGNTIVKGFDILANLIIKQIKGEKQVLFQGNVAKESWKPFETIDIPYMSNILLTDLKTNINIVKTKDREEINLETSGKADVLNLKVDANAKFIKNQQGQEGIILNATLPVGWKITDTITALKNTFFQNLEFESASLLVSNIDYVDPQTAQQINKGLNLNARIKLKEIYEELKLKDKSLKTAEKLFGDDKKIILLSGKFDLNPQNIVLSGQVLSAIKLTTDLIKIGPVSVLITGAPFIGLSGDAALRPGKAADPLLFSGTFEANPLGEIAFDAAMKGIWDAPFGLKGFQIGNLALSVGLDVATVETLVPSRLGANGYLQIPGKKITEVGFLYDYTTLDVALYGKKRRYTLIDMITSFYTPLAGAIIPTEKIAPFVLIDGELSFAPKDVHVGPLGKPVRTIPAGIHIFGKLYSDFKFLKDKSAEIDIAISKSGIKGKSYMTKIDIGPLHITGKGPDNILGTADDGPIIDIALSTADQKVALSGIIELTDLFKVENIVNISKNGLEFKFATKVGYKENAFDAQVEALTSGSLINPDLKLSMLFKDDFTKWALAKIKDGLNKSQEKLKSSLQSKIDKVNSINDTIASNDKDIDAAKQKIQAAQDDVSKFDNNIKETKAKINSLREEISRTSKLNLPKLASLGTQLTAEGVQLGGLKTEQAVAQKALDIAKKFLETVKKVDRGALTTTRDSAIAVLKTAQASGTVAIEGGKYVFKGISKIVDTLQIKEAKFSGSAQEIIAGKLPNVGITIIILGKENKINVDLDFKNIANTIKDLTDKSLALVDKILVIK